jgi:hypothetical protein
MLVFDVFVSDCRLARFETTDENPFIVVVTALLAIGYFLCGLFAGMVNDVCGLF